MRNDELIELIKSNESHVTSVALTNRDDKQFIKEIALAMLGNTALLHIKWGYLQYSPPSTELTEQEQHEIRLYVQLIINCLKRNNTLKKINNQFSDGLIRLASRVRDLRENMITVKLFPSPSDFGYMAALFSVKERVSYLLMGLRAFATNLLGLLSLPFLAIATLGKAVIGRKHLISELAIINNQISNNLQVLASEGSYQLGEMYKDDNDFEKAFTVYSQVPQSDENYVDALYEAGCIALIRKGDTNEAIATFKKGLSAAAEQQHPMRDHFIELLKQLDDNLETNVVSDEHQDSANVKMAPIAQEDQKMWAAANYATFHQQAMTSQRETNEEFEQNPLFRS